MNIETLVVGPIEANCYLVSCPETKEAVVIDPGDEADVILAHIAAAGLKVRYILLTHGHHDHIEAVDPVRAATKAQVAIHIDEHEMLVDPQKNHGDVPVQAADILLHNNDQLEVGPYHFQVIYTPGHTKGGCCFYEPTEKVCFTGDTLFKGTVGRTDLYGGDYTAILNSVRKRLAIVADETVIYPGHGDSTTMGLERKVNPYVR